MLESTQPVTKTRLKKILETFKRQNVAPRVAPAVRSVRLYGSLPEGAVKVIVGMTHNKTKDADDPQIPSLLLSADQKMRKTEDRGIVDIIRRAVPVYKYLVGLVEHSLVQQVVDDAEREVAAGPYIRKGPEQKQRPLPVVEFDTSDLVFDTVQTAEHLCASIRVCKYVGVHMHTNIVFTYLRP